MIKHFHDPGENKPQEDTQGAAAENTSADNSEENVDGSGNLTE